MQQELKGAPVRSTVAAPSGDTRIITARYTFSEHRDLTAGSSSFFACRVETISSEVATLSVPVSGEVGDPVRLQVDKLGELRGFIAKRTRTGFVMSVSATDAERAKLKVKIDWFKKFKAKEVENKRQHDRFAPANPHSLLVLADGSTLRCFVIDMSSTGAAVSANVTPPIGTPLALGTVVGRVARHLPSGFAIQFIQEVDVKDIEGLAIKSSI